MRGGAKGRRGDAERGRRASERIARTHRTPRHRVTASRRRLFDRSRHPVLPSSRHHGASPCRGAKSETIIFAAESILIMNSKHQTPRGWRFQDHMKRPPATVFPLILLLLLDGTPGSAQMQAALDEQGRPQNDDKKSQTK